MFNMNEDSNSRIRTLSVLLAALVAVSAIGGTAAAAAASSTVSLTNTQDLTDDTGQVDIGFVVDASSATDDVTLTKLTGPDGTSVTLNQTVTAGSSKAVQTDSGTSDDTTVYTGLTEQTELPVDGTLTLTYEQNGTSYTDTIDFNVDSDGDGIPDATDRYPQNAPTTEILTASDNDSVETAYVEVASSGNITVTVNHNGTTLADKTTNVNLSDGEASQLVEVDVGDGDRDLSEYTVIYESEGLNVTDTGLTYQTTSGGGSTDDGASTSSPLSGYSDTQIAGGVVVLAGAGILLLSRD